MTVARHGEGVLISQSRKERRGHADEKFRFFHFHLPMALPCVLISQSRKERRGHADEKFRFFHFHLPMALPSFLSLKSLWTF